MRIAADSAQIFRTRMARVIALSAAVALVACNDITAPKSEAAAPEVALSQGALTELAAWGSELDGMTGWSLAALPNEQGQANIVGILNGLKGHLASGKIAACQQDITDARSILAGLTDAEQVEVGAVSVTLDFIESALANPSQ
jgi:hypothetical protein